LYIKTFSKTIEKVVSLWGTGELYAWRRGDLKGNEEGRWAQPPGGNTVRTTKEAKRDERHEIRAGGRYSIRGNGRTPRMGASLAPLQREFGDIITEQMSENVSKRDISTQNRNLISPLNEF
jgi:hypothetical protein